MSIMYFKKKTVLSFFGVLFSACLITAHAAEFKLKGITVSHPHLIVFGKNAKSGVGYFVVSNKNSSAVVLNEVNADFGVAMLHRTDVDKKGIAKMTHLKNIIIPGNGVLKLEPGGVHLMFMNIETEFDEHKKYPVTLFFEGQGSIDVDFILNSRKKNKIALKVKIADSSHNLSKAHSLHVLRTDLNQRRNHSYCQLFLNTLSLLQRRVVTTFRSPHSNWTFRHERRSNEIVSNPYCS